MKIIIKHWMTGILIIWNLSLQAQVEGYIPGDENYTQTLKFHNIDTLLVVVPRNYIITEPDRTDMESFVFRDQYQKKPVYV